MRTPRLNPGCYVRFNYQGGTLDKRRFVFVTEVDFDHIRGFDIDQDGFRTFQKSKVTNLQHVESERISTVSDIADLLGPSALDELIKLATPLLLQKFAAIQPYDSGYHLAVKEPGVRLVRRELRIGGKTITFNKEGLPTSGGRSLESMDDFLKEVASGTTGR